MISVEMYRADRPYVIFERHEPTDKGAWARLQEAIARGIESGSASRTVVHADVFLSELEVLRELKATYRERIEIGPNAVDYLKSMAEDRKKRERVTEYVVATENEILSLSEELKSAGFKRELRPFQLQNLFKLIQLPHGADFSVPGAGKTTVALANFSIQRFRGNVSQLAIVAPIAAFEAWREELINCFDSPPKLHIQGGDGSYAIRSTEVFLTNYNRAALEFDVVRSFVARDNTQLILDEAHRVKRGSSGVHGRAVLDLAYSASRRDVLTGTPAPQGATDLVALISFLYPGQDRKILPPRSFLDKFARDPDVLLETSRAIERYFVRTPKLTLDLPPTKFNVLRKEMGPIQKAIYKALVGQYSGEFSISEGSRRDMARVGRVLMYLLEAATNPMLLTAGSDESDDPAFLHPPLETRGNEALSDLLAQYANYEFPWKYSEVIRIVGEAAASGQKVLVWSSFVKNIKVLAKLLSEFDPAIVHGGVPFEAPSPGKLSRDQEFFRFRNDPNCHVLLANPAACGEGVSLHHWCHHAVYLDRTFNAGHFLQSQDRIHRLGLKKGTLTQFTLLLSAGSVDDVVDTRLVEKVSALAQLMNDRGLVDISLPDTDEGLGGVPAAIDDFTALADHMRR